MTKLYGIPLDENGHIEFRKDDPGCPSCAEKEKTLAVADETIEALYADHRATDCTPGCVKCAAVKRWRETERTR